MTASNAPAQQAAPRDRRQIVGDEYDIRLAARVGERLDDARRPGADIVEADQIGMIGEEPRGEGLVRLILIAALHRGSTSQAADIRG